MDTSRHFHVVFGVGVVFAKPPYHLPPAETGTHLSFELTWGNKGKKINTTRRLSPRLLPLDIHEATCVRICAKCGLAMYVHVLQQFLHRRRITEKSCLLAQRVSFKKTWSWKQWIRSIPRISVLWRSPKWRVLVWGCISMVGRKVMISGPMQARSLSSPWTGARRTTRFYILREVSEQCSWKWL